MTVLELRDVSVRYGGILAVDQVSLTVEDGESVLLVGANGAGKSSLINSVIGLVPMSGGSVRYLGRDLVGVAPSDRSRRGIGYSPEGRCVFGSLTVRENLLSSTLGLPMTDVRQNLRTIYQLFPLLEERADQPANQLSGGQQQIVAIARAVSRMPRLLLLDEPFLGLAPVWIAQISRAIRELQAKGTTILMTEQMARPALRLVDRVHVMRGGVVRRSGTVDEIREVALAEEYL